jgi:hypothetical protein
MSTEQPINSLVKIDKLFASPNFKVLPESSVVSYQLIRDICFYLSRNSQVDIFGFYIFDYYDFANTMGYSVTNLIRDTKVNISFTDDKIINKALNSLIGHSLHLLGSNAFPIVSNTKETGSWTQNDIAASTELFYLQVISNLNVYRSKKGKVMFSFKLTDKFIENMHLNYFKVDFPYFASLKSLSKHNAGLQNLYLFLSNTRNRFAAKFSAKGDLTNQATFSNFTYNFLKETLCVDFSDESKNKRKIKDAFELLYHKTGATVDFAQSPNKTYFYEPWITFHNIMDDTIDMNNQFKSYSKYRELFLTMLNKKLWEFYLESNNINVISMNDALKDRTYSKYVSWKENKTKNPKEKAKFFVEAWNKYLKLNSSYESITENHYRTLKFVDSNEVDFKK